MDNTLLGPDPPKLAVGDEISPCLAPVGCELVEVFADYERREELDGCADDFVSAADGECLVYVSAVSWVVK